MARLVHRWILCWPSRVYVYMYSEHVYFSVLRVACCATERSVLSCFVCVWLLPLGAFEHFVRATAVPIPTLGAFEYFVVLLVLCLSKFIPILSSMFTPDFWVCREPRAQLAEGAMGPCVQQYGANCVDLMSVLPSPPLTELILLIKFIPSLEQTTS